MKTAGIIAIFLINVFMSKRWPRVGHPAFGGGPDRRHHGVVGGPDRRYHGVGGGPDRRYHGVGGGPDRRYHGVGGGPPSPGEEGEHPTLQEGMLITGGSKYSKYFKSVEAYNPYINKICKLPNLPYTVSEHTLCGGLLCGGHSYEKSCLKLEPWGFVRATVSLKQYRMNHLCWKRPRGVLLLGGDNSGSRSTTELVSYDGSTSESKFDLSHPAK